MKKALFILMMLLLLGIVFSYAQCGKKQIITASKTEYLDASGNVQRTVDESTTIEYNDSLIVITTGAEGQEMRGTVKSITCGWKTAYKEGKTVIKAPIVDPRGDVKNLTITIEGKEGKLVLLAEAEERPERKIRIVIDKFEEKSSL